MRYLQVNCNNKLLWSGNHLSSHRSHVRRVGLLSSQIQTMRNTRPVLVRLSSQFLRWPSLFPFFPSSPPPLFLSLPLFPTLFLFSLSIHPFSCIFSIFPFLSFPLAYFSPPCSLLSPASSVPLVHAQQLEHQEQLRKQLQESKSHEYHMTRWNLC